MRQSPINFALHEKQYAAFDSPATELLYGGAAGGGKSYLLRVASILFCASIPGLNIYLFRREYDDLYKNHVDSTGGYMELLAPWVNDGLVKINRSSNFIKFWNGSIIYLCHCQHEKDIYGYQGTEIHVLMIDELTQFTENMYRYLRSRVRLGGLNIPAEHAGRFPRVMCSANPGNIGHQFVKATFIDYQPAYDIKQTEPEEGGFKRQFIPAYLQDNPTMEGEYAMRLQGLGSPELVRAMLEGDWDINAGAAFEKLRRDTHMIRPFDPPRHWTRFTSMDWGSAKPFSVGWYTVVEGDTVLAAKDGWPEIWLPDGAVVRYREYYGWSGKTDEGCRLESPDVAKRILEIENGEKIDYRVADSAMWAKSDGPSVQERMYRSTDGIINLRQAEKDRTANYQEMRARIAGEDGVPMFYVTENCIHFWRTVPSLQLDMTNPEKGPDTRMEDHVFDEVAYALRSRPMKFTLEQRHENARKRFYRERDQFVKKNKNPYSVKKDYD